MSFIDCPYLRDLLDQPAALRNTLESLTDSSELRRLARDLHAGRFRRIVLTGMGSSYHALYPLHLALTASGHCSLWVETSELIHYMRECLTRDSLLVSVSQSGQSAETLGLLDLAAGRAPLIAVTNDAASPLALRSDACLVTRAGAESTVSCKTYLASLLTLDWLAAVLMAQDEALVKAELEPAAEAVEAYLADHAGHVEYLREALAGVCQMYIAGRGASLAAAGTAGLILKESARFSAEGMSSAAFRHGPMEAVNPAVFVLVLAGDERCQVLNRRLVRDIRLAGGCAEIVDMHDAHGPFLIPPATGRVRPILEILPAQMTSLALAALKGHEPGKFELATKITVTE